MNRRDFLTRASTFISAGASGMLLPKVSFANSAKSFKDKVKLQMPPLLDVQSKGAFELTAQPGSTNFLGTSPTQTMGFNGSYLGPTLRLARGSNMARVHNSIDEITTIHWHGLLIPGDQDGGPHQPIAPGESWEVDLDLDQPPATTWYHSHVHGRTSYQVYQGLAGVMQICDGRDRDRGLPDTYGVDDLMLVLQDRNFDSAGHMLFTESMMDTMHGLTGSTMLVNGQVDAVATPPKGLTRLRLLNGSNARVYTLIFSDRRNMHLIATDSGYLEKPITIDEIRLSPGERAEVLVDFSDGNRTVLMYKNNAHDDMMGSMSGSDHSMMGSAQATKEDAFPIIPFQPDERVRATIDQIPASFDASGHGEMGQPSRTREFTLNMEPMAINNRPFDMERINENVEQGAVERWIIRGEEMPHPFHVHGAAFKVVSQNGKAPRPEETGWKDTVLVEDESEILIRFEHLAGPEAPFMYHCHILEHEDAGMMGQFTVSPKII
ncbi:multicopper oxidase domain-containing protein [Pseudovibrio ascidiaceicola]|uniref:multicopper oxidase domain-containing protein n=1 Tax=Pseudovibrio ascidiaceicola TaxID=285279 RepID=UPI003D362C12